MVKVTGTRLRSGDVLQLDCGSGVGLLGYVGKHKEFGDLTWVVAKVFFPTVTNLCDAFSEPGYFQFYPATAAARSGLVRKVAFCAEAMRVIPTRHCNMVNLNEDGTVRTWNVCDGVNVMVRTRLSDQERQLPVGWIVNHESLLYHIRTGWTPDRLHPVD